MYYTVAATNRGSQSIQFNTIQPGKQLMVIEASFFIVDVERREKEREKKKVERKIRRTMRTILSDDVCHQQKKRKMKFL
jgi:hypothetical protein